MSEEEKKINSEWDDLAKLETANLDDEALATPDVTDDLTTEAADKIDEAYAEELAASADQANDDKASADETAASSDQIESDAADYSDDKQGVEDFSSDDESAIALEFNAMDNVINGKKRKQRKKKKKMSRRGKMIEYVAIACVCVALLSVLAYFGSMLLGGETPTQGLTGADVIVDMTDCEYYFGTTNAVDLTKTFPGGTGFKLDGAPAGVTLRNNATMLSIQPDSGTETFELSFNAPAATENGAAVATTVTCRVKEGGVNIADWTAFRKAAKDNAIIVLQDNIACPKLQDLKRKDHGTVTIHNDIYGNGKIVNLFELVCTRVKANSKKYGAPYLMGNGKTGGEDGIAVRNKIENPDEPVVLQDVHFTGNDMSIAAPVYEGDSAEGASTVADGDSTEEKVVVKEAGNLYGLTEADLAKRGVLLFSRYASVVDVKGDDDKANAKIKHCVIENGGKVLHINNANVDIEGTIVRNAADTAISVGTYANSASVIHSKNNVIANSLTGGVLFYCFDGSISEANAEATWNHFYIDGFLDIYNWKEQKSLAFLPETEDFASIANPIAGSEIPKPIYNPLKGQDDAGNYYIHFAIIKIRTGGGLPRNDSQVYGYENIGYSTARENNFENGFPIPSIASAIMKDIDVWGYYGNSKGSVYPTRVLGGENEDDLKLFYKELREGKQADAANN